MSRCERVFLHLPMHGVVRVYDRCAFIPGVGAESCFHLQLWGFSCHIQVARATSVYVSVLAFAGVSLGLLTLAFEARNRWWF